MEKTLGLEWSSCVYVPYGLRLLGKCQRSAKNVKDSRNSSTGDFRGLTPTAIPSIVCTVHRGGVHFPTVETARVGPHGF